MELLRLNVLVEGTAKSKRLQKGEQENFAIPMWIANPEKNLESVNDYVNHVVLNAPNDTGDLILNAFIESAQAPDDIDTSPNNPAMRPYMMDNSDEISWTAEQNVCVSVVEWVMNESGISYNGDSQTTAMQIYEAVSGTSMFGWCNVDATDAIEIIEMILNTMFVEDE